MTLLPHSSELSIDADDATVMDTGDHKITCSIEVDSKPNLFEWHTPTLPSGETFLSDPLPADVDENTVDIVLTITAAQLLELRAIDKEQSFSCYLDYDRYKITESQDITILTPS